MDIDKARAFIKDNHRAVMMTYRRSGGPQLTPVAVGLDGEGRAIVSTRETAYKVHNLRRDPRVSLCVFVDEFYGEWIQIDGRADVVSLPDAMEPLVDYYKRTWGEHPDWDEYREAMEKEKRVLLRIEIDRAGPDKKG
ncbi:MAG: PPOX class F420-dependent oxidoreductase [Anaerolineales bacterium]|jgi:PPOX class probable F420-dependent enzyme